MALDGFSIKKSRNVDAIMSKFRQSGRDVDKAALPVFRKIGHIWKGEAKKSAPRSPTKAEYQATLVAENFEKTERTDFNPGGLERSIKHKTRKDSNFGVITEVFVASNAEAGKYAFRMHEEKGKTWNNWGPGSLKKPDLREKYIEGPRDDNIDKWGRFLERELAKHFGAE